MTGAWLGLIANEDGKMVAGKALRWLLIVALAFAAGGCGIGPPLLRRDRLGYQVTLSVAFCRLDFLWPRFPRRRRGCPQGDEGQDR